VRVWLSLVYFEFLTLHDIHFQENKACDDLWVANTHNITTCGTTIFLFRFCCSGIRIWLRICTSYIGLHKYGLCVCTYRRNYLSTWVNLLLLVDHLPVKTLCRMVEAKIAHRWNRRISPRAYLDRPTVKRTRNWWSESVKMKLYCTLCVPVTDFPTEICLSRDFAPWACVDLYQF
jgi:hypothetical protein